MNLFYVDCLTCTSPREMIDVLNGYPLLSYTQHKRTISSFML